MADHPVPEGDDIILPDGTKVGTWNGDDVKDLQVEVQRIIKEQKDSGADRNNLLIRFGIPHFDQTPDHERDCQGTSYHPCPELWTHAQLCERRAEVHAVHQPRMGRGCL